MTFDSLFVNSNLDQDQADANMLRKANDELHMILRWFSFCLQSKCLHVFRFYGMFGERGAFVSFSLTNNDQTDDSVKPYFIIYVQIW